MDVIRLKKIKRILRERGIKPWKHWGQNFLISKKAVKKILEAGELNPNDVVLEVGPGIGNLTLELAKRVKKVFAVEKDKRMVEILKEVLKCSNVKNVKVIREDILKIFNSSFFLNLSPFKVVANIPYYLTSRLIKNFLQLKKKPLLIVLTVQKEVAERIGAVPPKMNLLAISVQFYAKVEIVGFVSKKFFWPQPKVDSAIIKIVPKRVSFSKDFESIFFKLVKAGFSHPRKQLINNLANVFKIDKKKVKEWLLENGISPSKRAENLTLENWQNLAKNVKFLKDN